MRGIQPAVALRLECLLGEGPMWLPGEQALRFVDIKSGLLHRFDPIDGRHETIDLGGKPSFIVPSDEGLVFGDGSRICGLRPDGTTFEIARVDQPADNRTNDATVDHAGRLWFGTMDDTETSPTGAVWCLDGGQLYRAGGEAVVTNGPAISPDDRWLYHVDSGKREIWRFPLGGKHDLTEGDLIIALEADEGHPDGIVVDAEGCLWVALWDGWAVRRYSADGELLLQVDFPCARVTKLAFGGRDLRTAFVTTARVGLSEDDLAGQPLAGSLFTFISPVAGLRLPSVKLSNHAG